MRGRAWARRVQEPDASIVKSGPGCTCGRVCVMRAPLALAGWGAQSGAEACVRAPSARLFRDRDRSLPYIFGLASLSARLGSRLSHPSPSPSARVAAAQIHYAVIVASAAQQAASQFPSQFQFQIQFPLTAPRIASRQSSRLLTYL